MVWGADPRVVAVAQADPDYVEARRLADGTLRQETYFVLQGRFFPGMVRDRSLEQATARSLARHLAPELARQNYVPASTLASADLMLVVHWGTSWRTRPEIDHYFKIQDDLRAAEDERREMSVSHETSGGNADLEANAELAQRQFNESSNQLHSYAGNAFDLANDRRAQELVGQSMAELLGFAPLLAQRRLSPFGSAAEATLRGMLEDERYFIIVVAYDFAAFRSGGQRELKRLWTCRLSQHSPGTNFRLSAQRLAAAGGTYFGRDVPALVIERRRTGEGVVEVGEPTVVDW